MCIDKGRNIILSSAEEFKAGQKPAPFICTLRSETQLLSSLKGDRRFVGMVMIPGKHLTKMEVEDRGEYM